MNHSDVKIAASDAKEPFFLGVDVGGTNVKIGLLDDDGSVIAQSSMPTNVPDGPEEGMRRMSQAGKELVQQAGANYSQVARVGLATPGTMDVAAGMMLQPHNLPGWFDFPARERLSHYCEKPVTFVNDANAAAYGEFWRGAGSEYRSMILLTLGTGVGGGILIDHHLVEGSHSHGAECGHIIIDMSDDARVCPCGQLGHLEGYASGTAVISRTKEALDAGRKSSMTARLQAGEELTPLLVAEEAEAGDELALEIVMETARYLGVGIVTLLHTIDPDGVVLAGAMTFGGPESPLGQKFLARIQEEVRQRAFPVLVEKVVIDFATLGGEAGYIGAAGVARMHFQSAK